MNRRSLSSQRACRPAWLLATPGLTKKLCDDAIGQHCLSVLGLASSDVDILE
ncbi:MAG: hypothetical protein WB116_11840 [Candidatus Dormiibacterota bacterium]